MIVDHFLSSIISRQNNRLKNGKDLWSIILYFPNTQGTQATSQQRSYCTNYDGIWQKILRVCKRIENGNITES